MPIRFLAAAAALVAFGSAPATSTATISGLKRATPPYSRGSRALATATATEAGAAPAFVYQPPVDAPIVDPYRPPTTPYGPGNRGIDYAVPGQPVRAAAPGTVVFAGRVGLGLHVVVLHPDGIRTSYSFLASVSVRTGQHVNRGDIVGVAGPDLHFGARTDRTTYIDPTSLFFRIPTHAHLVAWDSPPAATQAEERAAVEGLIRRR